ncbi:MAG: fibronectin type III domain-containing protein [Paludibacteraceae bacterium]|nr:fibronectin type III domain-containing protein [Paludibacteraceae bacterium]
MKKIFYVTTWLLFLFSSIFATVKKPYLEVPTPNGIYINWKSDSEKNFTIYYGTDSNNLNFSKTVVSQIWSDTGYDNNYIYSSVRLTGLIPNTAYYYRITNNNGYQSNIYNFQTYPQPGGSAHNGITRFLIMGDNQLKDEPRYDSLVVKAKRFIENRYGKPIQNVISSCIMAGDQVDLGTLVQYDSVSFDKTKYISPYLGTATTIGNHETYGTLKLNAYYNHFHYDSIMYKVQSGTEDYYAYQAGTTLFIHLTTEGGSDENTTQYNWLKQVVDSANTDTTVSWIITVMHRPYQAEQYVGDISSWFHNTVYPFLITSPKMFMCIGAHHHLYARGQDKNAPVYNIISGGTAWDQYWGMSTEKDFDEVQKTITRWAYQILEIDQQKKTAKVTSYSIGYTTKINDWGNLNKFVWEESLPIDSFYVTKDLTAPLKPSITNVPTDSVEMPYTFTSSAYSSPSAQLNNSTQFQISSSKDFSTLSFDVIRDYEDLFGKETNAWETVDANKGVNIFSYTPTAKSLVNGTYYLRVRHRDRSLNWSQWSDTISFNVKNGSTGVPTVKTNKTTYTQNENIQIQYLNGPGNTKDWVGIYKSGETPGGTPSTTWAYVNSSSLSSGSLSFSLTAAGEYYATFCENDGYTEIANRVYFYVGQLPKLDANKLVYSLPDSVKITVKSAPANSTDWVGIYKIGQTPSAATSSTSYKYITADSAVYAFTGLPKGYYYASYFLNDGYTSVGDTVYFSVGDTISTISTDKSAYDLGDLISVTFADGPGKAKDWLGIYAKNSNPNIDPLLNYVYVDGKTSGTTSFASDNVPKTAGDYYVVFFTNDSYNEISNRVYFKINSTITDISETGNENKMLMYPNPMVPGQETVIKYQYPIDEIEIYSLKGGLIYSKKNSALANSVILNHSLPAGIYLVRVHSNNQYYTLKLTVKNG